MLLEFSTRYKRRHPKSNVPLGWIKPHIYRRDGFWFYVCEPVVSCDAIGQMIAAAHAYVLRLRARG